MPRGIHMRQRKHRLRIAEVVRTYMKTAEHRANLSKAHGRSGGDIWRMELCTQFGVTKTRLRKLWKSYAKHRSNSQQRKIVWEFTFELWLTKWRNSGKLLKRGRRVGQYVMARNGDKGPYSPSNTKIKTCSANLSEQQRGISQSSYSPSP
jgi:hypothetical protein